MMIFLLHLLPIGRQERTQPMQTSLLRSTSCITAMLRMRVSALSEPTRFALCTTRHGGCLLPYIQRWGML